MQSPFLFYRGLHYAAASHAVHRGVLSSGGIYGPALTRAARLRVVSGRTAIILVFGQVGGVYLLSVAFG